MSDYKATIGIECHVQLKTKTKLFSSVGNDARNAEPNTLISHICLGMPGALPVLNKSAVDLAIKAGYALNTKAQKFSAFDRKHYFYPDLPKGYQISQLYYPIIIGGYVEINVDEEVKKVGITRAHIEEDAGKNTHPFGKDFSLVDLNRAGTPLLEIVSEPDIHSAIEAKAYARELYLLMKYSGVSEADLYYGNMRFDVNVSVSKTSELGNRTETKNLNSFRSVEKAVDFEIKRQTELLDKGEAIVQETRGWDDSKQKTFSQRSKEDAHDYRYMPDPDIPPIVLEDSYIDDVLKEVPVLPSDIRANLTGLNIPKVVIEDIVSIPSMAYAILDVLKKSDAESAKKITGWFMHSMKKLLELSESGQTLEFFDGNLESEKFIRLAQMVNDGKLNSNSALEIFWEILVTGKEPEVIANDKSLIQVSDTSELENIVDKVLAENEKAASDVSSGEMKAVGFLVGQVMKMSDGKANPVVVQKMIKERLG